MNVFSCLLNSVQLTSLSRRLAGKLFQIRGPAAAQYLSPKRIGTRVTYHLLREEDLRERAELSEARWISSASLIALGILSWQSWIKSWTVKCCLPQNAAFIGYLTVYSEKSGILHRRKWFSNWCLQIVYRSSYMALRCSLLDNHNLDLSISW